MSASVGRAERSEGLGFPRNCITPVATACVSSPGTRTVTRKDTPGPAAAHHTRRTTCQTPKEAPTASFASWALPLGEELPTIGRLLGHRRLDATARYAHLARDSVRESAERIALSVAADIL